MGVALHFSGMKNTVDFTFLLLGFHSKSVKKPGTRSLGLSFLLFLSSITGPDKPSPLSQHLPHLPASSYSPLWAQHSHQHTNRIT